MLRWIAQGISWGGLEAGGRIKSGVHPEGIRGIIVVACRLGPAVWRAGRWPALLGMPREGAPRFSDITGRWVAGSVFSPL